MKWCQYPRKHGYFYLVVVCEGVGMWVGVDVCGGGVWVVGWRVGPVGWGREQRCFIRPFMTF